MYMLCKHTIFLNYITTYFVQIRVKIINLCNMHRYHYEEITHIVVLAF